MCKQEENGSLVMAAWYESTFEKGGVFEATQGANATWNQFFERSIHLRGDLLEIGGWFEWLPFLTGL